MKLDELLVSTDRQALFAHAVEFMAKQGAPAVTVKNLSRTCAYLVPETGRRCAVGCLLRESMYQPTFESLSPRQLIQEAGVAEELPPELTELLFSLQAAHDRARTRSDLVGWLSRLAVKHDLDPTPINEHMPQSWQEAGTWN